MQDAANARDWTTLLSLLAPGFVDDNRRGGIAMVMTGEEALSAYRAMSTLDECRLERTLLATRDEHLALTHTLVFMESGEVGPATVECLTLIEVDELGRFTRQVAFDVADVDAAYAELDRARSNAAWRRAPSRSRTPPTPGTGPGCCRCSLRATSTTTAGAGSRW